MSGASFEITLDGLAFVQHRLAKLSAIDTRKLLRHVGAIAESQTRRRINKERTAPSGEPWEPLSKKYAAWKSTKSRGGLLRLYTHLLDSITYEVNGDEVLIGTNVIYGATNQYGSEDGRIPARPYLGLSSENQDDLEKEIVSWLDKVTR